MKSVPNLNSNGLIVFWLIVSVITWSTWRPAEHRVKDAWWWATSGFQK